MASSSSTPQLSTHSANKIDYLYEVNIVPESANNNGAIIPTDLPLVNPYSAFARSKFSLQNFKSLVMPRSRRAKEYVQASKMDQHPIPATR